MCKNKSFFHFVFAKNEPVKSTGREAGLPDTTSTEVSSQMLMKECVIDSAFQQTSQDITSLL
jgi:hypothetical protein